MSTSATTGAIALGTVFVLITLSVLGWRYPSSIGSRLILGMVLGAIGAGSLVFVSDSVTQFVAEAGLAPIVAQVKQ